MCRHSCLKMCTYTQLYRMSSLVLKKCLGFHLTKIYTHGISAVVKVCGDVCVFFHPLFSLQREIITVLINCTLTRYLLSVTHPLPRTRRSSTPLLSC